MTCYFKQTIEGKIVMCGNLGPHCADSRCSWVSDSLCDYPVGDKKTCNRPLCDDHAYEVAPDIHYCAPHYNQWIKFKNDGGVTKELGNVTPYNRRLYQSTIEGEPE